jgi:RNA polymerase sigma factor (sigma-70 family)
MQKGGAMDSEELIIKNAAEGDEHAFRFIVEKYKGFVYAVCFNILKEPQEAENAAQETFLKVYRSLPGYEYRGFKTWIGKIATTKSIDLYRKKASFVKKEISLDASIDQTFPCEYESVHDIFIRKERKEKIHNLCSELPDIYRIIIKKYYFDGMSYQSIADSEGISIRAVESRLYRAKKMLREKWEEENSNEALQH